MKLVFLFSIFCFLVSSLSPKTVWAASLCDALDVPCFEALNYTPSKSYQQLAYTYQPRKNSPQNTDRPFDPTLGIWITNIPKKGRHSKPPAAPGRYLMVVTDAGTHNAVELMKFDEDLWDFVPVWSGKMRPEIAVTRAGDAAYDSHVLFATFAPTGSRFPEPQNPGQTEFMWLLLERDSWWNQLSLHLPPLPGTNIGNAITDRLSQSDLSFDWDATGLSFDSAMNGQDFRNVLLNPESQQPARGDGALHFDRVVPHHPVAMLVPQSVWPTDIPRPQTVIDRGPAFLNMLRDADVVMKGGEPYGPVERTILTQWLPIPHWSEWRPCSDRETRKIIEAYVQRIVGVHGRIETVSDQLVDNWDRVLPRARVERFDALHSQFGLQALPVVMADNCPSDDQDRLSERLDELAALAEEIATEVEGYLELETREELRALAAYKAFSQAYGAQPHSGGNSLKLATYFLKERSGILSRNEDYSSCSLAIGDRDQSGELLLHIDANCNGEFEVVSNGNGILENPNAEYLRDVFARYLHPDETARFVQFAPEAQNIIADFLINTINIEYLFYGIFGIAKDNLDLLDAHFEKRRMPYTFSSTTFTSHSNGTVTHGPTESIDFTADDYSFAVITGDDRLARYTISIGDNWDVLALRAEFSPALPSTGVVRFWTQEVESFEFFTKVPKGLFAPALQQNIAINGQNMTGDQMTLAGGFMRDLFEPMAHHLVMALNISAISE